MEWTQDKIETLTNLWRSGFTARQIAGKLGEDATRNAVIGKAHRLGLSHRAPVIKKRNVNPPLVMNILKDCQWPFGEPGTPEFYFCQAPVVPNKPYCEAHCKIAYRPLHGGTPNEGGREPAVAEAEEVSLPATATTKTADAHKIKESS